MSSRLTRLFLSGQTNSRRIDAMTMVFLREVEQLGTKDQHLVNMRVKQ